MAGSYFLNYHELVLTRIAHGQTQLYPHQVEALLAIYQKAARGQMDASLREAALILAGVGTGKTLVQALVPYILAPWIRGHQALMLSDNTTLRNRFIKDFPCDRQHRPLYEQWLLYSLKVLLPGVPPPQLVELDATDFNSFAYTMPQADILVGNRQFVVNLVGRGDIEPDKIGVVIIDEAHFSAANSYRTITNYFSNSLLCYFTGSKFRSDSQALPHVQYSEVEDVDELGRPILRYSPVADYEFSVQDAWKLNPPPIKRIMYKEATSSSFLIEEEGSEVEYDPDEFLLRAQTDKQWFRQILLADSFSLPVLEMAVQILLRKRSSTGQPHAMLVRALNVPHVHRVAKLLEDNFPVLSGKVLVIHSEHEQYDLAGRASALLESFYAGQSWVIVHCGLVGVGFDHKWVSVSCCLCILKSMSPAEQEWGRSLRRVPGPPASVFPELNHPNWAVIVTHSALQLRDLFEKFLHGVTSDVVKDSSTPVRPRPRLTAEYEAGETVLKLSDTAMVKPGDVLQVQVPVVVSDLQGSPKFSLLSELQSTGSLTAESADNEPPTNGATATQKETPIANGQGDDQEPNEPLPLPWQKEADAIGDRLTQLKSMRTYQIQVEAVLDNQRVQIAPAWCDFPAGVEVNKTREPLALLEANFLAHVGLDWLVLVDNELVSYSQYKRQVVLQKRGMALDKDGEIVVGGVRLRETMPPAVFELLLNGLEAELETAEVEVPHSQAIARPDKAKTDMQSRYGTQVKALIQELFRPRHLISDGATGRSLVEKPVALLAQAIARVQEKGHEPDFANNSALIHAATFGAVKEKTGRGWSEHSSEAEYQQAIAIARQFLGRLREQLQWRPRR